MKRTIRLFLCMICGLQAVSFFGCKEPEKPTETSAFFFDYEDELTISDETEYESGIPASLIESSQGEWLGIVKVTGATGSLVDTVGYEEPVLARITFDEKGYCTLIMARPTGTYHDISIRYELGNDTCAVNAENRLYLGGFFSGYELNTYNTYLSVNPNGSLKFASFIDRGQGATETMKGTLHRLGEAWDEENDVPYMNTEMQAKFAGKTFSEISAELQLSCER